MLSKKLHNEAIKSFHKRVELVKKELDELLEDYNEDEKDCEPDPNKKKLNDQILKLSREFYRLNELNYDMDKFVEMVHDRLDAITRTKPLS